MERCVIFFHLISIKNIQFSTDLALNLVVSFVSVRIWVYRSNYRGIMAL
ncbi:Uncharacterised protein [Vibrio cholerae]|nr:Uncharacterised protein [Vibrio cholerae]